MTVVVIAAFGTALALTGMAAALRRTASSPYAVLDAVHRPSPGLRRPSSASTTDGPAVGHARGSARRLPRPDTALARRVVGLVEARGWLPADIEGWLTTADRTLEEVVAQIVLASLCALAVPVAVLAITVPAGIHVPVLVPLWAGVAMVVIGGAVPVLSLRSEALVARRAGRAVVAAFLDLVVLCLAGGMGIEGALHASATVADDPVSLRLRHALLRARDTGETPWQALADLGRELRIDELSELSAAVGLAGTEGARIRSTLSAKAASIRRHQLAEAETEANTITERLFLPGMVLLVGFLLFVGYPALARILSGF